MYNGKSLVQVRLTEKLILMQGKDTGTLKQGFQAQKIARAPNRAPGNSSCARDPIIGFLRAIFGSTFRAFFSVNQV